MTATSQQHHLLLSKKPSISVCVISFVIMLLLHLKTCLISIQIEYKNEICQSLAANKICIKLVIIIKCLISKVIKLIITTKYI